MNASKPIEEFLLVALNLPSLKLTAKAPENGGKGRRSFSFWDGLFSGAIAVSFSEGISLKIQKEIGSPTIKMFSRPGHLI